jgi:DNA mismatch endonuclease (patch repair protein)
MAAVGSQDTGPELILRRALHERGLRYRLHARDVVGRPDMANRTRRVAIFVDGDFWHGNPSVWERRGMASMEEQFPPEKRLFWTKKLKRNIARDLEVNSALESEGWRVVRVWESEVRANPSAVAARIAKTW